MKALISPQENNRVAEVAEIEFPVANPLYWIDCPDDCKAEWIYDGVNFINPSDILPTPEELQEQINNEAIQYLNSTDWYVVRFAETGTAIPQDILDARQAARDKVV